mmetsp:Transcript_58868/g.175143  ORF Transcript_58868/g.175143 Transcript_58868/m.175143 type:complete len:716 (-) Transcript_58868:42-2189(-)|eukprot:CAMPEP_0113550524 /NCGR_PEP_ID=MMETSP0015_2-20120614/14029_1 /TAXON_ID=2838 /ORGANISM="Odontella" /LENGTH=715 /DNA_ID=CAMNT_0000451339 /DNA_START=187 /DNA_END=2334 /DNA_ORIENTATION=+ /assembly_acc=CAM_ASM_000160
MDSASDGDFANDDYSYSYSDEGEEYGSEVDEDSDGETMDVDEAIEESVSAAKPVSPSQAPCDESKLVVPRSKPKVDMSILDNILSKCNEAFPEAVHIEDESFMRLVTAQKATSPSSKKQATSRGEARSRREKTSPDKKSGKFFSGKSKGSGDSKLSKRKMMPKTSTGKSGVGYEMGNSTASSSDALTKEMNQANKRQRALDEKCSGLMKNISSFLENFDGDEGFVLLALKMSPGFNRMLFSLFKNDSLMEWGSRRDVYIAALDLVEQLGSSKFLSPFLLHDLLEGDGTHHNHTSDCQTLLGSLHQQADAMKRNQELLLKEKETDNAGNPQISDEGKASTQGKKLSSEESLARDIIDVCDKIICQHEKAEEAIRVGRKVGTISEEIDSAFLNIEGNGQTSLSEKEDIAAYNKKMQEHRLKHVALVDAVNNKKASHKFFSEKDRQGKAKILSTSKTPPQRRMLRITSEISGLAADLPVHWASGVFVRVDEDRPDVMKAVIMAPEDTPYENGVFEFDIFLPLSYPNEPPCVHLITTGKNTVRFNPNLYQEGKVCLSLLGTWSGPSWIPEKSTLLQVLVSIQSLILVQDPYFNEPGYDPTDDTQRAKSKVYDKQIRAATLKVAILGQMKKPTPLFEDCIHDHFRLKKRRILKQLEDWEALEKGEGEEAGGTTASSQRGLNPSQLVAQGGIRSSQKIVSDLVAEIKKVINQKWPDPKKEE